MENELRCGSRLHAILLEGGSVLEIKCRNPRCGAESGVVVLHRWDLASGKMLETQRFRDPVADKGKE